MKIRTLGVLAAAGLACTCVVANGELIGDAVTIHVTSDLGEGEWTLPASAAQWQDGRWYWGFNTSGDARYIRSGDGTVLATMTEMAMTYVQDPQININFAIQAAGFNTHFTISTGLLTFAAIDAEARASAAATLTDLDDDFGGGAGIVGHHAAGKMYRANYNGSIPAATQFATLVDSLAAGDLSSNSDNESSPGSGFTYIGNTTSMQAMFDFTLSANDSASGTSTFITRPIPTPGALGVLGVGMLVLRRRR